MPALLVNVWFPFCLSFVIIICLYASWINNNNNNNNNNNKVPSSGGLFRFFGLVQGIAMLQIAEKENHFLGQIPPSDFYGSIGRIPVDVPVNVYATSQYVYNEQQRPPTK